METARMELETEVTSDEPEQYTVTAGEDGALIFTKSIIENNDLLLGPLKHSTSIIILDRETETAATMDSMILLLNMEVIEPEEAYSIAEGIRYSHEGTSKNVGIELLGVHLYDYINSLYNTASHVLGVVEALSAEQPVLVGLSYSMDLEELLQTVTH